jgi:hypothetical protein
MNANRSASPRTPSKSKSKSGAKRVHRYTAATADKYDLYQKAVQSPALDIELLARIFRTATGREPLHLREDFCGTGLLSSHWIRRSDEHTAEGFDIDPEPIAWGLAHNFADLRGKERERVESRYSAHLKDVREPSHRAPDLRVALNFSYWIFKTRPDLLEYFRAARESLVDDGVFVIDLYGGPSATSEELDKRACGGFTYIWEQASYWPGSGDYLCHIRFRFPDGTEIKPFTYNWRMWFLTELRDVLYDAGFSNVDAYFEGTDEKGTGGNGIFRRGVRGENCEAWLAYLAARK